MSASGSAVEVVEVVEVVEAAAAEGPVAGLLRGGADGEDIRVEMEAAGRK